MLQPTLFLKTTFSTVLEILDIFQQHANNHNNHTVHFHCTSLLEAASNLQKPLGSWGWGILIFFS